MKKILKIILAFVISLFSLKSFSQFIHVKFTSSKPSQLCTVYVTPYQKSAVFEQEIRIPTANFFPFRCDSMMPVSLAADYRTGSFIPVQKFNSGDSIIIDIDSKTAKVINKKNESSAKLNGLGENNNSQRAVHSYVIVSDRDKATINAIIKVSPDGTGTYVALDKGSTSGDSMYIKAIKLYLPNIKFNKADHESIVTVPFNFQVHE